MRTIQRSAALIACMLGALAAPTAAQATSLSISGSMEGAIQISNGDWVSAGYVFSVQGSHPAMNVWMENASVVFSGSCSNGGTDTLTVPLSAGPYSVPANDNSTYPTGDEASSASFEGAVQANVCGGKGTLDASKGATFSGDLESDNTANAVQVQFHYRDPNAKGKGNYDCSANNYAASVCGASWSGTAKLTPSTPPACVSSPTASGCQSCSTSSSASGCSNCSTNSSAAGCTTTTPASAVKGINQKRHRARKHHKKHKKHRVRARHLSRRPKRISGFTG